MTLEPGTRLGHYEILEPLGKGGMGEVYRARDTKLNRDVALKILPEAFAKDSQRMGRFQREAQVLASLNHPNIGAIHGLEDSTDTKALVLEIIEGPTLAARIARGPIPVEEALKIALQIAGALEAAHEKGIIHRDLKPENVKITPEGTVKVLDFGLAKAMEEESQESSDMTASPTLSLAATKAGVILGTAAYMSPEQARGRSVDKRADIWAFGVVLWEMLSGRGLFDGETVSDVLAGVLKTEIDVGTLPASTPPTIRRLLRRCLDRNPKNRLHDIADARIVIDELIAGGNDADWAAPPVTAQVPVAPVWRRALPWAVGALGLIVGIVAAVALVSRPSAPWPGEALTYLTVTLQKDQPLAFTDVPILALSPDGRKLAFTVGGTSGQTLIHLRSFDRPEARPVVGSEGGNGPFFSPDGASLGFFADGRLKTVSLAGGAVVTVAEAPTHRGAVWEPDGSILFSPEYAAGLWRVPAAGGVAELVLSPETEKGERTYRWPDLLPGGRAVVFTVGSLDSPNDYDAARIVAYSFATGQRHVLVNGAGMARFLAPNTLVYSRGGVLFAVPFDTERLEVVGQPTPVLEGVAGNPGSGASHYALALDGTLAAVRGTGAQAKRFLTLVDRQGVPAQLPLSARGFRQPRFSPDGFRLAFTVDNSGLGASTGADVWIYSLGSGNLSRLTFDGRSSPLWSPDGYRIAYWDNRQQTVLAKPADGSGAEESLHPPGTEILNVSSWSPDGRSLALTSFGAVDEIYILTPGEQLRLFEKDASAPAFSPDGRWIAYTSPAVENGYVFVRPVSGPGKWQVSRKMGGYPRWSGDGRELFYIGTGVGQRPLMVVPVARGDSFRAGSPRPLIPDLSRYLTATAPSVDWDAAPAGDHFVFIEVERATDEASRIDVALHWGRHLAVARPGSPDPER